MELNEKIFVAGHRWLVWSAIKRVLEKKWYKNIVTRTHFELDLMDYNATKDFFEQEKPDYVFLAAAKVWWIIANQTYPADFIYKNLQIQNNVIHCSYLNNVKKLMFLWSNCIYPRECPQPIKEEYLLTWPLEKTNEPYAISKIAWIKMCQSYNRQYWTCYMACMPINQYWPYDHFGLTNSHVFPAMIRKFHEAKINNDSQIVLWWDWSPYREFMHAEETADAAIYLMNKFEPTKEQNEKWDIIFNIGTWHDITIKELAEIMKRIIWFEWKIVRDTTKPNGTPRKILDNTKLYNLWWRPTVSLEDWIKETYKRFLENYPNVE